MAPIFFVIIAAVVAIVLVGGLFSHRAHKERQEALALLATELDWSIQLQKNYEHEQQYDQFNVFTTGQSRYAYNSLTGSLDFEGDEWPSVMGDYHYQTTSGTGKNRRTVTHQFSYLVVQTPYAVAPDLRIRREQLFDRLASFMGFDDIDFESSEFSDHFHVKSENKRFAYDVIHPRMMEFLLADTPPMIHFKDGHCCIHTEGKCWSSDEFRSHATWMQEFFSHWPSHLTSSLLT